MWCGTSVSCVCACVHICVLVFPGESKQLCLCCTLVMPAPPVASGSPHLLQRSTAAILTSTFGRISFSRATQGGQREGGSCNTM